MNKNIFSDMPMTTVILLLSQIRCAKRATRRRTWTDGEKVIVLSLHKHGPKCYSLFLRFIALLSIRTLQNILSNIIFKPGVNRNIFEHLGQCISKQHELDCLATRGATIRILFITWTS